MLIEEANRICQEIINAAYTSGNSYAAVPCTCGAKVCKDWHISPNADIQGVGFTKKEAQIAAQALNEAEKRGLLS